jgi:hypothetical protein
LAYIHACRTTPLWLDHGEFSLHKLLRDELEVEWLINPFECCSGIALQGSVDFQVAFDNFINEAIEIEGVSVQE